jgi:pyridoxamine 5'-phosphate oxidase
MAIQYINLNHEAPYLKIKKKYDEAVKKQQKNIDAIAISSYSKILNEVNSRFVNLKFIDNKEFIFFSNYRSPKSTEFSYHNQITALIYWNSTNTQIRIKAKIKKTSNKYNQKYFSNRSSEKNALAISSNQSNPIESYAQVEENYNNSLSNDDLKKCPEFWGGYSFTPYYFEFWEGHESRLNKREAYIKNNNNWDNFILQP